MGSEAEATMHPYPNYALQMSEMTALQAIYADEFEEIQFPWKVEHPPQYKILVTAGSSCLEILFKMSTEYPQTIPTISLIIKNGISPQTAAELRTELNEYAGKLIGREMAYDLVEFVRTHLEPKKPQLIPPALVQPTMTEISLPLLPTPTQRPSTPISAQVDLSFKKEVDAAISHKQSQLKALRKRTAKKTQECTKSIYLNNAFYLNQAMKGIASPITSLSLVRALRSKVAPVSYIGKTQKYDQDFFVEEFILPSAYPDSLLDDFKCSMALLIPLKHPNLVSLFSYEVLDGSIFVISDFIKGESLEYVVEKCGGMKLSIALKYLQQILIALSFIHSHSLAHKCLCLSHVRIEDSPKLSIKLSGCGYFLDAKSLCKSSHQSKFKTKKDDIFACGIIFLYCIFGKDASKMKIEQMTQSLPSRISMFIARFFTFPPSDRCSVEDLLCFEFDSTFDSMNEPFQLSHFNNPESPPPTIKKAISVENQSFQSRYEKDFFEMDFIGKGGFGQVVKARNKLDNQIYAIKKILLSSNNQEENKKILREVIALSKFHHQYITRYYQAWVEECNPETVFNTCSNSSEVESLTKPRKTQVNKSPKKTHNLLENFLFNAETIPNFEDSTSASYSITSDSETNFEKESFSKESLSSNGHSSTFASSDHSLESNQESQILYIQMEFCPNMSLRDIIDDGFLTIDESWRLFRQILEALAHIHSHGMIHRDLKPGNIFLDSDGNVKIGDFGLVTDVIPEEVTVLSSDLTFQFENGGNIKEDVILKEGFMGGVQSKANDKSITYGMGTPFYTSPEVLKSTETGNSKYNSKVDMYSIGIIFFEMIYQMSTGMERAAILRNLRKNPPVFPTSFDGEKLKNQYLIINNLLSHCPEERMSSEEMLKSSLLPSLSEREILNEKSLETIFNPTTPQHHRIIKGLFLDENISKQFDSVNNFTFDYNCGLAHHSTLSLNNQFKQLVISAFERFFFSNIDIPLLIPWNPLMIGKNDCVKMLDFFGNYVVLPFDHDNPFARYCSLNYSTISRLKRYHISTVFKPNLAGGQPKHYSKCSLQIVANNQSLTSRSFRNAMLLKTLHSLIKNSTELQGNYELHINHTKLWPYIAETMRISNDKYKILISNPLLDFLATYCYGILTSKLKTTLTVEFGLSGKQVDFLHSLSLLKREFNEKLLGKLSQLISCSMQCNEFLEIKEFLSLISNAMEMTDFKIIFNPLLFVSYHDGLVFAVQRKKSECHKRSDSKHNETHFQTNFTDSKSNEYIASGGSIDGLLSEYNHSKKQLYGSSLDISVQKIYLFSMSNSLLTENTRNEPLKSLSVYVTSVKETSVIDKLKVANALWNNGIKCELNEENTNYYQPNQFVGIYNVLVFVFVKTSKTKEQSTKIELKVKFLDKKIEFSCFLSELIDRLNETVCCPDKKYEVQPRNSIQTFFIFQNHKKQLSQNIISNIEKLVFSLSTSSEYTSLIIYDYIRNQNMKNRMELLADDEFGKKLKQTLRIIWNNNGDKGVVLLYSLKEECFDIWPNDQMKLLFS